MVDRSMASLKVPIPIFDALLKLGETVGKFLAFVFMLRVECD